MNPINRPHLDSAAKLVRSFFQRPAAELAEKLIGTILVRHIHGREYRARIVETEAYVGAEDLASHASKGRTQRTEIMFGPPGHAYVYLIYGVHAMLNIVASVPGDPQSVLLRAAEPLDGWKADLSGPGKLTRALRIIPADNGLDVTGDELFFLCDANYQSKLVRATRIGVDYARDWKDAPLRFLDGRSQAVSKPTLRT